MPMMIFIAIASFLVSLAVILIIIYLLVLVRPPKRTKPDAALMRDYVHRGLHGLGIEHARSAAYNQGVLVTSVLGS